MAQTSCWLKPSVRNKNGEITTSKLFDDLRVFTGKNRSESVRLWAYLRSDSFRDEYGSKVEYDDNNEPILSSILKNTSLRKVMTDTVVATNLSKGVGGVDSAGNTIEVKNTAENYDNLAEKAVEFNTSSEYKNKYVAVVRKNPDDSISIKVERLSDDNSSLAKKQAALYRLNHRIRAILEPYGIHTSAITRLQDRLSSNGVVDYENARVTASGIIDLIKLAEGISGEEALPEEFAHLAIDVLSDDPIIARLIKMAENEAIQREVLGSEYTKYAALYSSDKNTLAREVAGKLVAKHLLKNEGYGTVEKEYKNFIQRAVDKIKSFFKRLYNSKIYNSINDAIVEADELSGIIANRILSEDILQKFTLDTLKNLPNLHQVKDDSDKVKEIAEKAIFDLSKQKKFIVKTYKKRLKSEEAKNDKELYDRTEKFLEIYEEMVNNFLSTHRELIAEGSYYTAISGYISFVCDDLMEQVTLLKDSVITQNMSLAERASQLSEILNRISSYKGTFELINELLGKQDSKLFDESTAAPIETIANLNALGYDLSYHGRTDKSLRDGILEANSAMNQIESILLANCRSVFSDYLSEFLPEGGIDYYGRVEVEREVKGRTVKKIERQKTKITKDNIEELLRTADKDISRVAYLLRSISETDDIILQLGDKSIKRKKDNVIARTNDFKRKHLLVAAKALTDAGIKDQMFMFEKHSDGSLSGRYVTDTNWTKFIEERNKAKAELSKEEYFLWLGTHTEPDTGYPKKSIYGVDIDEVIGKKGTPKRDYYDFFMDYRNYFIDLVDPELLKDDPARAIQISKDLMEKLRTSNPKEWKNKITSELKNKLISKVDDTQFGKVTTDFNGEEKYVLPIFYVDKIPNEADLSRDTVSTLLAFAEMAINYDEMSSIEDYITIGTLAMENRQAYKVKNNRYLTEINRGGSQRVKVTAKNIIDRWNELVNSQFFGRYMHDGNLFEGTDFEIKANKAAGLLNEISALNQLALNALAGLSAITNDMINVENEALQKRFFTASELKHADNEYRKHLVHLLAECTNPIKTDKMSLFIEKFNLLHDFYKDSRDLRYDRKGLGKIGVDALYLTMHIGSHFGETRTAIAQAMHTKIKSDDGTQEKSLWDILEVKYIDENDHSKGATLEIADGFTLTNSQLGDFGRKCVAFNGSMFGHYDDSDRNALQATAAGQLIMMYRRFMLPGILRRFDTYNYNIDLNKESEGFYISFGKYLRDVIIDSKNYGRSLSLYWESMDDFQKSNCLKAIRELCTYGALGLLVTLLKSLDFGDKKNPWYKRWIYIRAKRAQTELGALTPFGVFGETFQILKSPAAGVTTLESFGNIVKAFNPWNYEIVGGENAIITSGRFKGHSKSYKYFMESPLVPMNKTVYKIVHPEIAIQSYNR